MVGFPALDEFGPILQNAVFQRIGGVDAPIPATTTADRAMQGTYDAELIPDLCASAGPFIAAGRFSLVMGSGAITFVAEMDESLLSREFADLENGALLQLTGVLLDSSG